MQPMIRTLSLRTIFILIMVSVAAGVHAVDMTTFKTLHLQISVGSDGVFRHFIDLATGKDYANPTPWAYVTQKGQTLPVTSLVAQDNVLTLTFGNTGVTAMVQITTTPNYIIAELRDVQGEAEKITFVNFQTSPHGLRDGYACCALAMNLRTQVLQSPLVMSRVQAVAYSRLGMPGAKVAFYGCPLMQARSIAKEILLATSEVPHSQFGGPWAKDHPEAMAAYLTSLGNLTEDNITWWIDLAHSCGFTEIQLGGTTFRYGDFCLDPKAYPRGAASLKAVVDRLHAAGLKVGLHTYSFAIAPNAAYVTPVPDPRLAKTAVFTLARPISDTATDISVTEAVHNISPVASSLNSIVMQIDNELVIFHGVVPSGFSHCQRGAYGTHAEAHAAGAIVAQLTMRYFDFVPDPDSTLFTQVAANTANLYNICGFDSLYLDALDGADIFAGVDFCWYYAAKFADAVNRRLRKPAEIEMSTFSPHLWNLHTRISALDIPHHGYRDFIDVHVLMNQATEAKMLPVELGWCVYQPMASLHTERMYPEDIAYLCCKALATDAGISFSAVKPEQLGDAAGWQACAAIFKAYADVRQHGHLSEALRSQLRKPGEAFELQPHPTAVNPTSWTFRHVQYLQHKVDDAKGSSTRWTVTNPYAAQPVRLRIEALTGVAPVANPLHLLDINDIRDLDIKESSPQVVLGVDKNPTGLRFTVTNTGDSSQNAWATIGMHFSPAFSIAHHEAMSIKVYGDGQGEVLNLQLRNRSEKYSGISDHYIPIDFTGWRSFTLLEPETHCNQYNWPYYSLENWSYTSLKNMFMISVDNSNIDSCSLWYTNLPPKKSVTCIITPIICQPPASGVIRHPSIIVGNHTLRFPVDLKSGCYLEYTSPGDGRVYDVSGKLLTTVTPEGGMTDLAVGDSTIVFSCENNQDPGVRASVTISLSGDVLREQATSKGLN